MNSVLNCIVNYKSTEINLARHNILKSKEELS